MKKNIIILSLTAVITLALCTIFAMYSTPGFGHCVTVMSKDGGMALHPVLLGLNKHRYVFLVTGTVKPPFKGNVKIVLEGLPEVNYKVFSRYPPYFDFGIHKFNLFNDNTLINMNGGYQYALTISIKPDQPIITETHYKLNLYDSESDEQVLSVPVIFKELVNFSISKNVRRPVPERHGSRPASGSMKTQTAMPQGENHDHNTSTNPNTTTR